MQWRCFCLFSLFAKFPVIFQDVILFFFGKPFDGAAPCGVLFYNAAGFPAAALNFPTDFVTTLPASDDAPRADFDLRHQRCATAYPNMILRHKIFSTCSH